MIKTGVNSGILNACEIKAMEMYCFYCYFLFSVSRYILLHIGRETVLLYKKDFPKNKRPRELCDTKFNFIISQGVFKLSKAFYHNGERQGHELKELWTSHLNLFYLNFLSCMIGLKIIYSLYREILRRKWIEKSLGIIRNYEIGIVCI